MLTSDCEVQGGGVCAVNVGHTDQVSPHVNLAHPPESQAADVAVLQPGVTDQLCPQSALLPLLALPHHRLAPAPPGVTGGGVTAQLSLEPHIAPVQTNDPPGLADHLRGPGHCESDGLCPQLPPLPPDEAGDHTCVLPLVTVAQPLYLQVTGE